uniref:Uncharacterized protein n=1 Tax=Anopheles merus TaxID=30066 RepID=A0A182UZX4_ANOME
MTNVEFHYTLVDFWFEFARATYGRRSPALLSYAPPHSGMLSPNCYPAQSHKTGHGTTLVSSCRVLVACWYFCCWPAIESRTTTSRGCRERQAAPHGRLPPAFAFVLMPHAFSSVKISVKKPGSALMRSMFEERRFTISKHLEAEREREREIKNLSFESSTRNGFSG